MHLFLSHVWKHHSLPQKVVLDRGPQFVAEFTWEIYWLLGIKLAATTAYHPQGDRQTEQVNQTVVLWPLLGFQTVMIIGLRDCVDYWY